VRVGRRVRIKRSDFQRILDESYSGNSGSANSAAAGPSADDFWGGEPVGFPEAGGSVAHANSSAPPDAVQANNHGRR
jgi:hypothetical protein